MRQVNEVKARFKSVHIRMVKLQEFIGVRHEDGRPKKMISIIWHCPQFSDMRIALGLTEKPEDFVVHSTMLSQLL